MATMLTRQRAVATQTPGFVFKKTKHLLWGDGLGYSDLMPSLDPSRSEPKPSLKDQKNELCRPITGCG
ncbi:hypothetical protein GGTG_01907 [Gaeumannomyces tritici R3-111a-1]|uniref:Uncharacterized protein n=1 Tax=Gaeumannomyces tritici (strain R3-111a-1) TaxID=644352 RepID=J3NKW6_GAET3|nr:hypothetical protein GGTG_01907 [Gaeumannomyces tritici R3-111a-1]EJT81933.1 hypothetical protein GGTG_01907 [Gaeumannomyces tritici R3-111a-1]